MKASIARIRSYVSGAISRLRPSPDEVLVLRVPGGKEAECAVRDGLREVGAWPKLPNGTLVLVLPPDVDVRVEPKLKPAEDLGYRETANQRVDADASAESKRAICGATQR